MNQWTFDAMPLTAPPPDFSNHDPDALERAALTAWPALAEERRQGWSLRWAQGYTKRANSANPLCTAQPLTPSLVTEVQQWYDQRGLPAIFRLPDMVPAGADELLAREGYALVDPSLVLWRDLRGLDPHDPACIGSTAPPAAEDARDDSPCVVWAEHATAWLDDFQAVAGAFKSHDTAALHLQVLKAIGPRCAWGVLRAGDHPVACALGVLSPEGLLGLFDVVTRPSHWRRGAARKLCQALLRWGRDVGGAHTAYLQVVAANAPARALYQSMGFSLAYRYHYRVRSAMGV